MNPRSGSPTICLVTDRRRLPAARRGEDPACDALVELARAAGRAGVDIVQVRERGLDDRRLLRLVERIVAAVQGSATRVVVNDRADIAFAAGADGVHVRSGGPLPMRVRAIAPTRWLIGRSVHGPYDVRPAEQVDGADYAICGTVFESASKPGRRPLGVDGLADIAGEASLPVLAIGGVDAGNAPQVAEAGAAGVAAIGYFADGWRDSGEVDLEERVAALRTAFDKGGGLAYFRTSMSDTELPEELSPLREARERRGLSLEEIADTTKISVSALEALERYDASSLPGGIFTRAFVRSYATEVCLDPETVLREFLAKCPEAEPVGVAGAGEARVSGRPRRGGSRPIGLRLALLAAPLIALGVFVGVRACGDLASARGSDSAAEAVTDGAAVAPSARRDPPGTTAPAMPPPVEGALVMEIHPSGDCWVSATVDGEPVLSRLIRTGERQTLRAVESITVSVGDAGAFDYTLNDEPGRTLGSGGEVVTETITPNNYRDYLSPQAREVGGGGPISRR